MPLFSDKKHVDVFLGEEFDVGLDPNFEFDGSGKLLAITVDYRRFVVEKMVYELSCIVGRATRVWVVRDGNKRYVLKDSWIQDHYVDSEVTILQKMNKLMENDEKVDQSIKESIPIIVCGSNVEVNGILDCTGCYRKDLRGWTDSQRTHRHIVSSPIGEPIITFCSKKEFIQAIISIIEGVLLCSLLHC